MSRATFVVPERRLYNKWVASDTLEDYALRFTADAARRWTAGQIVSTALGASAFLACEAIGASITLLYGFSASVAAILASVVLMFLIGLPIAYRAARHGLDIDLLTRGAGFGYLGSTITSLIYASFTFLLFAVEGSIMGVAVAALTGLPLAVAYILSVAAVVPIAIYGMSAITRFQAWTQPVWIVLQLAPVAYILWRGDEVLATWTRFTGIGEASAGSGLIAFGMALSLLLSLLPQIGEQADYLRFLPGPDRIGKRQWWAVVIAGGPGWTLIGGMKLLLGSVLASWAMHRGMTPAQAQTPTDMFMGIFDRMTGSPGVALFVTAALVIVCQLKINVTNAYAGSIAWSNVFARLTHRHPGRVAWLLFNVALAMLLLVAGIEGTIGTILPLYSSLAAGWIGALAADLVISKPLGWSPPGIEFRRAHLYDLNPVGIGAMGLSIVASGLCLLGAVGETAQAFAPLLGLVTAFVSAPVLAWATKGRFFIARAPEPMTGATPCRCVICENTFEPQDMAHCPAYSAPICSLCCTLESRCLDICKKNSRATQQMTNLAERLLPAGVARHVHTTLGHFVLVVTAFTAVNGLVLGLIAREYVRYFPDAAFHVRSIAFTLFVVLFFISGLGAWLIVLAHESRRGAHREMRRHLDQLEREVAAHEQTDAALQKAKQVAESANAAKSRYLVSVSHEIRSPLNSIYGYAQLLERNSEVKPDEAGRVIRRASEHLSNLVDGLLDIAQVEAGVLRLSRDTIRFPAFVELIASMFRPQASTKGLDFRCEIATPLPEFVRGDQKRLRQVLINVLSNAVKFTSRGSVTFRVSYRSELATFEVIDTGIGIDPEDRQRIFGAFERGNNAAGAGQPGIGLGLAITSTLIHVMGGDLAVDSEPGRGTTFTMRLMLSRPVTQPVQSRPAEIITGYEGRRRMVLVVDDDPAHAAVIGNLLRPLGFTVLEASDADTGIAMAATEKPDIVLLDISMPGKTGWEAAAELRAAHGDALRIVMVSADAHQFRRGGDGHDPHDLFLTKPLELETLLDTLSWQLDLRWTVREGNDAAPAADASVELRMPPAALPFVPEIERLARIGNVRAVQQRLTELENAVPDAADFAKYLRAKLECFDFKALREALKKGVVHVG